MFNIVLHNPQIPPNTGNIMRLCANTNCKLHLIKPMGFKIDEKSLKRAGMDYVRKIKIYEYDTFRKFISDNSSCNFFLVTKFGNLRYDKPKYQIGDFFLFGSETDGLPDFVFKELKNSSKIFIPMLQNTRSINLANAVSICIYEAWKQNYFKIIK